MMISGLVLGLTLGERTYYDFLFNVVYILGFTLLGLAVGCVQVSVYSQTLSQSSGNMVQNIGYVSAS